MKRVVLLIGRAVVTCLRRIRYDFEADELANELDLFVNSTNDKGEDFE